MFSISQFVSVTKKINKIGNENIRGIYFLLTIIINMFTQAVVTITYISTRVDIYQNVQLHRFPFTKVSVLITTKDT